MFSSKTAICMVLATAATLACIAPTNALVHGRDDVDSVDVDSVRARRDVKAAKGAKAGKVISAKLAKAPKAPKAPKTTAAPDQQAKNAAQDVIDIALSALVTLPLNDADKAAFITAVTADILALNNGLTEADIDSIVLEATSGGRARRQINLVAVKLVITFSLNTNQTEIANLVSAIGGATDPWAYTNAVTVSNQLGVWGFQPPVYTAAGATTTAAAAGDTTTAAPDTSSTSDTTTAAPDTTTAAPDTTTAAPDTTTAAPDTTTAAPDTTTASSVVSV